MTHSPGRILVVDDNEALRENLAEALELEGYDVAVAGSGAAALDQLDRDRAIEAVVLDLRMPGLDGTEVLRRIRQDPELRRLRVVVSTGDSGPRLRAELPADAFLVKPFGVRELLGALRQAGVERKTGT